MSIVYAIGDIHGEDGMLAIALDMLRGLMRPEDIAVFLGDYIDRGPNSARVLRMLREWRAARPNTVFLRGNHDQLLLDAYARPEISEQWSGANGAAAMLQSYQTTWDPEGEWRVAIPSEDLCFLMETKFEYQHSPWIFVHAGVPGLGVTCEKKANKQRMWIREEFIDSDRDFGAVVIFGHTPQLDAKPLIMANKVGIDTGAFRPGGRLTVATLDSRYPRELAFFQVDREGYIHDIRKELPARPSPPVHAQPMRLKPPWRTDATDKKLAGSSEAH